MEGQRGKRMDGDKARAIGYGAALFLGSAGALVLEIVAGRLLAPYVGMSLYSWTAIIATVLAGLSIGHWLGGRLAGPEIDDAKARRRIAWAFGLAALACLAALPLLRLIAPPLLASGASPVLAILALAGALFLLPSLFAGIVSPILTRLAVALSPLAPGPAIGRMYALGALGSILGTLAAGLLFLSWLGSTATVLAVAAIYGVLAILFAGRRGRLALALLTAGATLLGWGHKAGALRAPCLTESDYFCIRVQDFSGESGRESRVLVLDHLGHGISDRAQPGLLYSPYLHLADEMAKRRFGPEAISAFFIGGGAYTLPRAWLNDYPKPDLVVAEIDPAVTEIASRHLWLEPKPGLVVDHRDARVALQALPAQPRFQVVFGDAFHDIGIPPHLTTREFHREIALRLVPGGFYAINVIESRRGPRFLKALLATLRLDFAAVEAWLDLDEDAEGKRVTYLVVASDRPSPVDHVQAGRGIRRAWRRLPEAELAPDSGTPILTDDFTPVDRPMAHILLEPELMER
jgi:hypothetical protein